MRIVCHLNIVAMRVRCVSPSILGERDAGKSDLEAFGYSNSEAVLRHSAHKKFSNVYMKFFYRFVPRKMPLVEAKAGQRRMCELKIVVQAPLAIFLSASSQTTRAKHHYGTLYQDSGGSNRHLANVWV
jgi:hypothetical protein